MLACEAAGGSAVDALDAAVAMELLHTFTLVHDDIMDNASLRRGRATVHTRWDSNTAILAGDTIAALGSASLVRNDHPRSARIGRLYAEAFVDVCKGQALDKIFESRTRVSMHEYVNMIGLKTAALFSMAAAIGGTIASPNKKRTDALQRFGRELGLAFQIQDDALDIGADLKKFGKDHGSDIREGKKTFLYVAACDKSTSADAKALLRAYVVKRGLRGAQVTQLRALYLEGGALAAADTQIRARTRRAITALHTLPSSPARDVLTQLAFALTGRTY
jgi:geranylgeranyl diphosphate synthase type II